MKHSQLKKLIKEEIRSVLNEGLFDRFQKSDNKLEQAKKEIDQTDFNNFFIQPASFRIPAEEKSMIISQLKKRVAERLPTLISLFPNLVSGDTLYNLRSNVNGELIYGVTLGNLGGYITNDYLIIDNDIAKTKLKKNLKLDEGLFKKFTQATIDDVNDDLLKDKFDRVIKADDDSPINYEDRITEYVYDFIKEFSRRYKEGMFGPDPLSKRIDPERNMYREVRNKFKENGNQISVREIGEIVASNYLIKK